MGERRSRAVALGLHEGRRDPVLVGSDVNPVRSESAGERADHTTLPIESAAWISNVVFCPQQQDEVICQERLVDLFTYPLVAPVADRMDHHASTKRCGNGVLGALST